jgi:hypothetical protein
MLSFIRVHLSTIETMSNIGVEMHMSSEIHELQGAYYIASQF